jgi:hypothetical protein
LRITTPCFFIRYSRHVGVQRGISEAVGEKNTSYSLLFIRICSVNSSLASIDLLVKQYFLFVAPLSNYLAVQRYGLSFPLSYKMGTTSIRFNRDEATEFYTVSVWIRCNFKTH